MRLQVDMVGYSPPAHLIVPIYSSCNAKQPQWSHVWHLVSWDPAAYRGLTNEVLAGLRILNESFLAGEAAKLATLKQRFEVMKSFLGLLKRGNRLYLVLTHFED